VYSWRNNVTPSRDVYTSSAILRAWSNNKTHLRLQLNFFRIFLDFKHIYTLFAKVADIRFHGNPSSGSGAEICSWADGKLDMPSKRCFSRLCDGPIENFNSSISLVSRKVPTYILQSLIKFNTVFCGKLHSLYSLMSLRRQTCLSVTNSCRLILKCDGKRTETRFCLSAKRTSPFKSAGASVQSTTCSRDVRISGSNGSNAGYTMFQRWCEGYWLPNQFGSFPFTSPPVRHRVPSRFNRALQHIWSAVTLLKHCLKCDRMLFCTKVGWCLAITQVIHESEPQASSDVSCHARFLRLGD